MTLYHPIADALAIVLAAAFIGLIGLTGIICWALVRWVRRRTVFDLPEAYDEMKKAYLEVMAENKSLKDRLEFIPDSRWDGIACRDKTIEMQGSVIDVQDEEIKALKKQIDDYQGICSAVYQMAGVANAPVRFLDALSDAANGEIGLRAPTERLLPVLETEFEVVTEIEDLKHDLKSYMKAATEMAEDMHGDPSPERIEAAAVAYYAKWRELWKVSGIAHPVDWSGLQEHTREATRECTKAALLAAAKA